MFKRPALMGLFLVINLSSAYALTGVSGSLEDYLKSIDYDIAEENTWIKPNNIKIALFKEVFSDFIAGDYDTAHQNAAAVGYEVVKYTNTDVGSSDVHYILREVSTATFTGGGTYVLFPSGKNAALQVPHPKFDSNTAKQGIETYLSVRPRLLMLSGTRRDNSTAKSSCTDGNYFDSDVAHQTQSLFFAAHQIVSDADTTTPFIQFHGFGSSTLSTLKTQCSSSNDKLVNLSEGINYATPEAEDSLLHILRRNIAAGNTIDACVYGNDTTSLGGTWNVEGRYTNGSSDSCSSSPTDSSKRFIHIEQSADVRSLHRTDIANAINQSLIDYLPLATDVAVVGRPYKKQMSSSEVNPVFSLQNAPEGMMINPVTGWVYWTPTPNQNRDVSVDVNTSGVMSKLDIKVLDNTIDTNNIKFISSTGNNTTGDGSYDKPYADTKNICTDIDSPVAGMTIYYRGGIYQNPSYGSGELNNSSIPQVKCSGVEGNRVTLKPWGNEKVKIIYDSATGIRLKGNYINFENFEVEGINKKTSYKEALNNWWKGDRYFNGNGIAINGHHATIKNNVVHHVPGQAIAAKRTDHLLIEGNIVYNSAWWSVAGTTGIGATDGISVDGTSTAQNVQVKNNLIFGVESRIFSRVWSKGEAHLTIDEGEGFLAQINAGAYDGRYLIENNFLLHNGKGLVINKTHKADVFSNTLYNNGTTMSGKFRGLRGNSTVGTKLHNNAVTIFGSGQAYSMGGTSSDIEHINNCFVGDDTIGDIAGRKFVAEIFEDPQNFDFSIKNNECAGTGASLVTWNKLKAKADEYGIEIKPTGWVPDYVELTKGVIDNIPEGASIDYSTWSNTEEFTLNVTTIPTGVDGRPTEMTLEIVHPYRRGDIAQEFGIASQGTDSSYNYYSPASNAIDNDDSTYNHTRGSATENWWQVELPSPTLISKIMIQGRNSHTYRLAGAKVYITDTPYSGTLDENNLVATLAGNGNEQVTTFDTPRSGSYLIVKGDADKHIHLVTVEVFGELPSAPFFNESEAILGLVPNSAVNTIVGEIKAVDYQGDALTYAINEAVPFAIDNNGTITLTEEVNHNVTQSYSFTVMVSDGSNSVTTNVTVKVLNGNGVTLQRWNGISGTSVSDLLNDSHYQDAADETRILTTLDINESVTSNFGQKLSAILKPAQSGHYVFAIVGDDGTELKLSTNDDINAAITIASKSSYSSYQNWGAAGKSTSITLEAGGLYAIEALHKEAGGAEHVSVAWKREGEADFTVIPANQLYLGVLDAQNIKPVFNEYEAFSLISGATAQGATVAIISATDLQSDSLSYSIDGSVPFSIDNQGNITVSGTLVAGTYHFNVVVSDGVNSISTPISIQITSATAVNDAISSGQVTDVTEQELIQATLDEIQASADYLVDAKKQIFNLNTDGTAKADSSSVTGISWDPTHDASLLQPTLGKNTALLTTNAVTNNSYTIYNKDIAIIGEKAASRYMVMGSNPMRNAYRGATSVNGQMHQLMENSISWLTGRDNLKTAPFNVVISHLSQSYYFPDELATRSWLDSHYARQVNYNTENSCDGAALSSCLNSATDLLIISQVLAEGEDQVAIAAAVNQALAEGISVLYLHHDGNLTNLGKTLFSSVFDVTHEWDNINKKLSLSDYSPIPTLSSISDSLISIKTLFTHFKNADYHFDWSVCKDGKGVMGENNDNCSDVVGLKSEFQDGATTVRNKINALDNAQKSIFNESGKRFQKLLVLTADKFRQSAVYPMDKVTTDDNSFMRSFYADHAVYNYRKINPAQTDMGNFSRSDFSHITPVTKTVNLTSKKNFRSTGVYALPGQTVKVTRNDSSDLTVKVFINTLRSGATHHYQRNGYNRPKYLQTPYFEIKTGETIELTSPYGGTLQLNFNKNDLPVEVTFENVGEHPYWAGSADNASFAQKLDADEYDWAEIATAGFEVHSKRDKMITSVANSKWGGTAEGLANAVEKYTSNYPHVLAGFKGEGVDVVPEIHDWANDRGITIETIDTMKHMNADQATCGAGCSGNPYDAYWSFDPIGHGDVHEMGHSLQKKRFEGFPNHAATNTFSYYTKSRYFDITGGENSCGGQPFKTLFETIQSSVGQSDVEAYLKTNLWDTAGLGEQYLLKIQAMMHAQNMGKVENGWHVLARVHILEREKNRAKQDWEARKASIGFSSYTLDEFNAIRDNDWLIVSYSYAAGLDYRNYFDMMGIPYSQKARDQIASFGYDVVPNALFVSTDGGYCDEDGAGRLFDRPTLAIDGTSTWPAETDTDSDGRWDVYDNCPSDSNSDQADINGNGQGDVCDLDNDSDGASVEDNVPNSTGSGTGDGNGDGIADSDQSAITSVQSYDDSHWLTYRNTGNGDQSNFSSSASPLTTPVDQHLLYGATQFDVVTTSGANVTIEVFVDIDTAINDYWLLGNDGNWVAQNASVTHSGNKTKLTFSVTEGGNFDRDAIANGELQLAQGGVMVNSGLDAWPYAYLYGKVELNAQTAAKVFSIKNTGSRSLNIIATETTGINASEFVIDSDACTGQSLAANDECEVSASFKPTSIGSKSAMLTVTTDDPDNAKANIFLRNHESHEEESERRLPPVLNSFRMVVTSSGQEVDTMKPNTQYTVEWSILGYHEDYITSVVMFNCKDVVNNSCGDSFNDNTRFLSSGRVDSYAAANGIWSHAGVKSQVHQYRYTFTTPSYADSTPIVIRFYRLNSKDLGVGNGGLSLIIPGNHAEDYYDKTGRRVMNTIAP